MAQLPVPDYPRSSAHFCLAFPTRPVRRCEGRCGAIERRKVSALAPALACFGGRRATSRVRSREQSYERAPPARVPATRTWARRFRPGPGSDCPWRTCTADTSCHSATFPSPSLRSRRPGGTPRRRNETRRHSWRSLEAPRWPAESARARRPPAATRRRSRATSASPRSPGVRSDPHPRLGARRHVGVVRAGARAVIPVPRRRLLDVHGGWLDRYRRRRVPVGPVRPEWIPVWAPVERWPDPDEATAVEPVVTLESMPLEAAMPLEATVAADAPVRPAEAVPTATAVAPVRVGRRAAEKEQCCDQCRQPN